MAQESHFGSSLSLAQAQVFLCEFCMAAQLGEWLNSVLKWKFRELPLLRISQELWVSLDRALERMLSELMDKASDFPDPRDVEMSVAAVHCTVEENVMKDTVSEIPVREHQIDREVVG